MLTIRRPNSPALRTTPAAFWNRFAPLYDLATSSGSAGLADAASYIAGFIAQHDVVLDAACGTGAFACALAPKAGFVAASDLSPKMVEKARAKATPGISAKTVSSHYKAIVARQPEVGGMRNNLIMGLYLAAYFMAVWQAAPEMMDDETFEGLVSHITASKRFVKMNKGRDFFTKKNMETRDRLQSDPEFNSYPENWKYTFAYDLSVPECTITYTHCAICEMARREGCFRLIRYLCTTDYAQQELMGNTLVRTKTIGNGDELCDFHIIGKKR